MQSEQKIIYSQRAEQALIGSLIMDNDAVFDVMDVLTAADFYIQEAGQIYAAMCTFGAAGKGFDVIALEEKAQIPASKIAGYVNEVPTSLNARRYAEIIADRAARRRMLSAAGETARLAYDLGANLPELQDKAESLLFQARGRFAYQGVKAPNEYLMEYMTVFERQANETDRKLAGLPSGFTDLDRLLNGFRAPHHYILAGRPGMGKSAIAVHVADSLAAVGKRILFFSLEMSEEQIVQRRISARTRIPLELIQKPWRLTDAQRAAIYDANGRMAQHPFFIDSSPGITPAQVRAKANRIYAEHGIDMLIIDHLHIMRPDVSSQRRDQDFNEITLALAELGKRLRIPVITLAQLNRGLESRQDKRPSLADLRESGSIEENAFAVLFVYRENYYNELVSPNIASIIVAKHRDGGTGQVEIFADLPTMRFGDLTGQRIQL